MKKHGVKYLFPVLSFFLFGLLLCGPRTAFAITENQLQSQIANAPSGSPATITIDNTMDLTEPITIPAGKQIIFAGNGTIRLASTWNVNNKPVITVSEGASLILDGPTLDGNDAAGVKLQETGGGPGYGDSAEGADFILCRGKLSMTSGAIQNINSAESGSHGGIIVLAKGSSSFEMSGGEIKNNRFTGRAQGGWYHGVVTAKPGSTFTMTGGSIHHNSFKDDADGDWHDDVDQGGYYASGAVNLEEGSTMTMSGNASISYNDVTGVIVGAMAGDTKAEFVMNGGSIHHNDLNAGRNMFLVDGLDYSWAPGRGWLYGNALGGGVKIRSGGSFIMNDGTIHHNNALFGGGVAVFPSYGNTGSFRMNDGTISENTSYVGGGVYVSGGETATTDVYLVGGRIEKNEAKAQGGGLYVANTFAAHLENVIVYNNEAELMGGGLWSCPTADVRNFITNGGAIYNNAAGNPTDNTKAAADVASVPKTSGHAMYLANRILGGGLADYYRDGIISDNADPGQEGRNVLGIVTSDSVRYDPANPGEPTGGGMTTSKDPTALVSQPMNNAIALAEAKAKIIITQNKSERGGGIGTNGSIIIGTSPDPNDPTSGEYTLNVEKKWVGTAPAEYAVKVQLIARHAGKDYPLDSVTLTNTNPTATFTGLPEGEYYVQEEPIPGYTATYAVSGRSGAKTALLSYSQKSAKITITNSIGTPPPSPTDAPVVPPTGDGSHPALWVFLAVLALAGIQGMLLMGRGKKARQ